MRFVPVNCVREGMVAGRQLLGKNGELLLNKGTVIHPIYIEKLKELGYNGIYIDDDLSRDIEIEEIINENLRAKTIKTIKGTFKNLEEGREMSNRDVDNINSLINDIVDNILSNRVAMVNIIDLKVFDDYTFYHSVNVAVLSVVVGIALNMNKDQLYKLGLSGILHDLGKVFVQKEILNKPGKLTKEEFEAMKTHSHKGYQYLRANAEVPVSIFVGILQHHEKYDGTGYPMGTKGGDIPLISRIISIADIYDALTSDRPYRKAMTPSEAIEYIMGGGGTIFDPEIVKHFLQRVAPYPVGTCVCLSNGMVGLVMENYSDCCVRPRLKIFGHGNKMVEPYIVDLKNDRDTRDIIITGILQNI